LGKIKAYGSLRRQGKRPTELTARTTLHKEPIAALTRAGTKIEREALAGKSVVKWNPEEGYGARLPMSTNGGTPFTLI
jgi:hypothetical protein